MNVQKELEALKKHLKDEVGIHKEILKEVNDDIKHLVRKHLEDTKMIHIAFFKELKKAAKSR